MHRMQVRQAPNTTTDTTDSVATQQMPVQTTNAAAADTAKCRRGNYKQRLKDFWFMRGSGAAAVTVTAASRPDILKKNRPGQRRAV